MGKASRRPRAQRRATAPFVARPFEGLPGETDWVALRELLPAATATVSYAPGKAPAGAPAEVTVATVLPMAWPGLHRNGGPVFVATQSGAVSGDASRDIAAAMLKTSVAAEGEAVTQVPDPTEQTPRLQELVDLSKPFEVTVHEGFDFWVEGAELDEEGRASLDRANESAIATLRIDGPPSVYWCQMGERCYVRWVLPHDEDAGTSALARLHAVGRSRLGEDGRLLGAFRASGLLIPVWEVDPQRQVADLAKPVEHMHAAIEKALADPAELTAEERRARAGLLNRQVTLR